MKKSIHFLALMAVMFNFSIAHAQKKIDSVALKQTLEKEKPSSKELNQAYKQISKLIVAKRNNIPMKELLELSLLYFKHTGTDTAYDFAYDLKQANPEEFEKALKELTPKDAEKILEFIKLTEEEIASGQG